MRSDRLILWVDSSALIKWFVPEVGSEIVSRLLETTPEYLLKGSTLVQYAETYAVLLRRRNAGDIDARYFDDAVLALESRVLSDESFLLLSVDDTCYLEGLSLVRKHNLNCVDAACLFCVMRFMHEYSVRGVFVASDRRLLRAASEEGLSPLDPQLASMADVDALLTPR
ncbi:hypothetical protein HRbin16_03206 [bacterium HR16]|nr:hypothetical protein HRbin16_03206 [bacterium HR16]